MRMSGVCVCVHVWCVYVHVHVCVQQKPIHIPSFCGRYLLHSVQLAAEPSQYALLLLPATEESCHPV